MALDAYIGLFNAGVGDPDLGWARDVLEALARALAAAGLPPHVEPGAPGSGLPAPRVDPVRLGHYSAARYHHLEALCWHLAVSGAAPHNPDGRWVDGPETRQGPGRFAHLRQAHHGGALLAPLDFAAPLEVTGGGPASVVLSAPQVIAEADLLGFVVSGAGGRRQTWRLSQQAAALGLTPLEDPARARTWDEALELARRLRSFARAVVGAGALGYTG